MRPLQRALTASGAQAYNIGYRSRSADIATLAREVFATIRSLNSATSIDFVTHSLGGLVLRCAIADALLRADQVGRVVMLGPPNRGSELADRLPAIPIFGSVYSAFTGPAGRQLGTGTDSFAARLPPLAFETGIIAGTRSWNPFFSYLLGDTNDGKVRVDRTVAEGMQDFVEIPQWHPLLMRDRRAIEHTLSFLATGRFRRSGYHVSA